MGAPRARQGVRGPWFRLTDGWNAAHDNPEAITQVQAWRSHALRCLMRLRVASRRLEATHARPAHSGKVADTNRQHGAQAVAREYGGPSRCCSSARAARRRFPQTATTCGAKATREYAFVRIRAWKRRVSQPSTVSGRNSKPSSLKPSSGATWRQWTELPRSSRKALNCGLCRVAVRRKTSNGRADPSGFESGRQPYSQADAQHLPVHRRTRFQAMGKRRAKVSGLEPAETPVSNRLFRSYGVCVWRGRSLVC